MSSVPGEVLRDILLPLDRWTLDDVQFTDGRFLQLITERMSDVCLRQVNYADFSTPDAKTGENSSYVIRMDGRPERTNAHEDTARLFSEFVQALRSSRVACMTLTELVFTPQLVALVLQTPIVAGALSFLQGSCAGLTPTQFQDTILHFAPASLNITACQLRASHLTDGLLRALSMRNVMFSSAVPVDGRKYSVTDDAVVDFCMQDDVSTSQQRDAPKRLLYGELIMRHGSFTKGLFKRLVEASTVSVRTQPIRIDVSPLRFGWKDLPEFEQYLSDRDRRHSWQLRIYNFPGEKHGAVAAMHTQIVLHPDRLQMIRARRPSCLFYELHE
ncbi:hypothetical protein AAVH_09489 [Aphelenchoides avenae]|nr:hypothetical protein AAVH_09489 [Aphelenchus avenae]